MIAKQIILGSALLLGGVVTIFAMTQNNKSAKSDDSVQQPVKETQTVARPVAVPLTADVATEERVLAQKQREREIYNQQLAKEADALLNEQEQARMLALDKAKQEANPTSSTQISADSASKSELIAVPAVQTRPEAVEAARAAEQKKAAEQKAAQEKQLAEQKAKEAQSTNAADNKAAESKKEQDTKKAKTDQSKSQNKAQNTVKGKHTVAQGDTLIGLSSTYGVPVSALAAANNMSRNDALPLGRTINIPSASEVAKIERSQKQTNAQKPAKTDEKKPASSTNSAYNYSVQVAISPDKAKVDEMVKKYRAAGYQVSTSQTSRGTRVLIGSANSYDEANALKQKLAKDGRVDASGAWVKKLEK